MITRKHSSSLRVLHAQIWHSLPQNIKSSDSIFKLEDLEKGVMGTIAFLGRLILSCILLKNDQTYFDNLKS